MNRIVDKIVIFIFCTALYLPAVKSVYMVVPILIAIILGSSMSYFEDERIKLGVFSAFVIMCIFQKAYFVFIPLIFYDILISKYKWAWTILLLPLITYMDKTFSINDGLVVVFLLVAYLLNYRTNSLENIKNEYYKLRDNTKEEAMKLSQKNKDLMEKQDYEVNLATLRERNRIARDIHDNVGHLLSRCILQMGALLAINKDETTRDSLRQIKDTMSEAMDSIRSSVHDLHDESMDLEAEIQALLNNFKFCQVEFSYDFNSNLDKNYKYCFIAVIKEALSNIIKHSNATRLTISMREHPAIYQIVLQDNGTDIRFSSENGIGIKNIKDRVASIGGNVNISMENGFRIFVSVPKSDYK